MKVHKIKMNKKGMPRELTVTLSVREAAFLTRLVGKQNEETADGIMVNGSELIDIYNDFTGYFFNRFWESGVSEIK